VSLLIEAFAMQTSGGSREWSVPEGFKMPYQHGTAGQGELFLGGCYVRIFLKNPQFPLRDPKAFLEGLLGAYFTTASQDELSSSDTDQALVVAAAITALLKVRVVRDVSASTPRILRRVLATSSQVVPNEQYRGLPCLCKPGSA
jgi:hypothetical protein